VDRSAVVAASGAPINSNRYIALMAYITLRRAERDSRVHGIGDYGEHPAALPRRPPATHWPGRHQCGERRASGAAAEGAARAARRKYQGTTIVTDSVTSNGLTEFITAQVRPARPGGLRDMPGRARNLKPKNVQAA